MIWCALGVCGVGVCLELVLSAGYVAEDSEDFFDGGEEESEEDEACVD